MVAEFFPQPFLVVEDFDGAGSFISVSKGCSEDQQVNFFQVVGNIPQEINLQISYVFVW